MNVLKRMIIPRLDLTIRYILSELEELEREDTFRLKRVKEKKMRKVKGDGAGEQIEVTDVKEPKKEETPKPEAAKSVEEKAPASEDKELPPVAPPKEAAEMGDLIIIKPSDFKMEVGDVFIPPPQLKTMATITEVEELIEGISDFDEKEKNKQDVKEIPLEQNNQNETFKDITEGNLETGEWFETPSKLQNRPNLNMPVSEYSKMDKYKEVMGSEREINSTSAVAIPMKADESIMDIDKRALESLYKDIDSNYYKPTVDDIFSKHDIAMKDSTSAQDISILEHSLLDLESIDFSIDSKGKVVISRSVTGQSSPALSTHREVDPSKPLAQYDENGMLTGSMGRKASVKWLGDGSTRENNLILQSNEVEREVDKQTLENNVIEPVIKTTSEIDTLTEKNEAIVDMQNQNDATIQFDKNQSIKDLNPDDVINNDNLNNRSLVSLVETEVWTSDTEQIPKDPISQNVKTEMNDNAEPTEENISRSISDLKLSRISEEENENMDIRSKLSTLMENSKEKQIQDEVDTEGSVVSDKFEDSISSFHNKSSNLVANKKEISQNGISMKNNNELNLNNNDLEIENQEVLEFGKQTQNARQEALDKASIQSNLKMDEKVESARSSRDINKSEDQNELSSQLVAENNESQEVFQIDMSNLNETPKSGMNLSRTDETSTFPENVAEFNQSGTKNKHDLNRTGKETALKESNNEKIQDSLETTHHDNLKIEEDEKNNNMKELADQDKDQNEINGTKEHELKEYDEHKLLRIHDSDEIINKKRDSNIEQLEDNSQSKQTTYSKAKRKIQENIENKHTNEASLKENKEKRLTIQNSDEIATTNEEDKRTSEDSQRKESEREREEENEQNLNNARASNVGKRGKHSGDDHVKQD